MQPSSSTPQQRPRVRWYWRALVIKVWLAGCLLFLVLAGASVTLFMSSAEASLPLMQRLSAFAGATLILLLCLHILRMALPARQAQR